MNKVLKSTAMNNQNNFECSLIDENNINNAEIIKDSDASLFAPNNAKESVSNANIEKAITGGDASHTVRSENDNADDCLLLRHRIFQRTVNPAETHDEHNMVSVLACILNEVKELSKKVNNIEKISNEYKKTMLQYKMTGYDIMDSMQCEQNKINKMFETKFSEIKSTTENLSETVELTFSKINSMQRDQLKTNKLFETKLDEIKITRDQLINKANPFSNRTNELNKIDRINQQYKFICTEFTTKFLTFVANELFWYFWCHFIS